MVRGDTHAPVRGTRRRPGSDAYASISFSWRVHESHANHIIVRSWRTSSFHAIDWFCSRNSFVSVSHRLMFSGLTKSHATLMQSARLHTCRRSGGSNGQRPSIKRL